MYKVIVKFKDKYTNEIYEIGKVVKFTKKRAKEILEVGNFIEKVEDITKNNEK